MPISPEMRREMFSPHTGDGLLIFLEITHPNLEENIYVVNNTEEIPIQPEDGGPLRNYLPIPFDFTPPSITEDNITPSTITVDNVSLELTRALRSLNEPPKINIEVRSIISKTLETTFPKLSLINVQITASSITGELIIADIQGEGYPSLRFTPSFFPGLFA